MNTLLNDQEFGIESFVDELCAKLKNTKILSESGDDSKPELKSEVLVNNTAKVSPKEQALKYYAAFPALDDNSNQLLKPVVNESNGQQKSSQKGSDDNGSSKWNGQKIFEFINNNSINDEKRIVQTTDLSIDPLSDSAECLVDEKRVESDLSNNLYYCQDIEKNVLRSGQLVVPLSHLSPPPSDNPNEKMIGLQEDNHKFERLVTKFNRNIASIWPKTSSDRLLPRNDNIWSFDSSFSSNQSSATPSPKTHPIDLWSSLQSSDLCETLSQEKGLTSNGEAHICWPTSLLTTLKTFSDDGFIDGNHDIFDQDINWSQLTAIDKPMDKPLDQMNRTTLQNHEKNSPFVEFNSNICSNAKTWAESNNSTKLLSLASFVETNENRMSLESEENLLTSSKTHFQPIRQHLFDRDESDEGSVIDMTDKEVNTLMICSEKCPNNSENKTENNEMWEYLELRAVSTSLSELSSFMGPFTDPDLNCTQDVKQTFISEDFQISCDFSESQIRSELKIVFNLILYFI